MSTHRRLEGRKAVTTEEDWSSCSDPYPMLVFLNGKVSARKMRLFGCACCRGILHLLADERSHKAIEISEQFADGAVGGRKRQAAQRETPRESPQDLQAPFDPQLSLADFWLRNSRAWATEAAAQALEIPDRRRSVRGFIPGTEELLKFDPIIGHALGVADAACLAVTWDARAMSESREEEPSDGELTAVRVETEENRRQAALLRDLLGNPFRLVSIDPRGLSTDVRVLAGGIYEERAFDRLPILADALEEAGCTNPDLLAHCRHPGEHVRGCWALDLVLGKK